MIKAFASDPQLYRSAKSPVNPAVVTVSKVDKAICERALSRSGKTNRENLLSASNANITKIPAEAYEKSSDKKQLSREVLRDAIRTKRQEIKTEQEKLTQSLTTALCKSEEAILQNRKWMDEVKDLNGSFEKIPPITSNKKISHKGQSFYIGMD